MKYKSSFSGKYNNYNTINLLSAEFADRLVTVNFLMELRFIEYNYDVFLSFDDDNRYHNHIFNILVKQMILFVFADDSL